MIWMGITVDSLRGEKRAVATFDIMEFAPTHRLGPFRTQDHRSRRVRAGTGRVSLAGGNHEVSRKIRFTLFPNHRLHARREAFVTDHPMVLCHRDERTDG